MKKPSKFGARALDLDDNQICIFVLVDDAVGVCNSKPVHTRTEKERMKERKKEREKQTPNGHTVSARQKAYNGKCVGPKSVVFA